MRDVPGRTMKDDHGPGESQRTNLSHKPYAVQLCDESYSRFVMDPLIYGSLILIFFKHRLTWNHLLQKASFLEPVAEIGGTVQKLPPL